MTTETAKTFRALARAYNAHGFNIVPLGPDKRPAITMVGDNGKPLRFQWDAWQHEPQTARLLSSILRPSWWGEVGGLAAVCGPVSGGLVCIDFDHTFPELPERFLKALALEHSDELLRRWLVRTPGGGSHLWLRSPDLDPAITKLDRDAEGPGPERAHIELRFSSHMTSLPGSFHPCGGRYRLDWPDDADAPFGPPQYPPAQVEAARLLAAYEAVSTATVEKPAPRVKAPPSPAFGRTGASGDEAYAAAALRNEADAVRHAISERNARLNAAAFSLGQLVGSGLLGEEEVTAALAEAALAAGLEEGEIGPTIESGLRKGRLSPRRPEPAKGRVEEPYSGFGAGLPEDAPWTEEPLPPAPAEPAPAPAQAFSTWPYVEEGGRLTLLSERRARDGGVDIVSTPIADFAARIVAEEIFEDGRKLFRIEGRGLRGGPFQLEVDAAAFGEDRRLKALLSAAAGALDGIAEGMTGHLGPALKKLSSLEGVRREVCYDRTGWSPHGFLLPGLEPEGVHISLYRKLSYSAGKAEDLAAGLDALSALLSALRPEVTTIFLTALLQAPANDPLGWQGSRYAVFLRGRTGSFKTSFAQAALCLYGEGFADTGNLLKWGEGATRNALLALAGQAHDLPFFIDNYKPQTGGGSRDFVNVIHNILEGGERERLSREANLRDAKELRCLPVATGEDIPDDDAASLARVLVLTASGGKGGTNESLAVAQAAAPALSAVGSAWILWLASEEGKAALSAIRPRFEERRRAWGERLGDAGAVNANRLGATLAQNELAFELILRHPTIGPRFALYASAHARGLADVAGTSAFETAGALEAEKLLSALRELYVAGRVLLPPRLGAELPNPNERDRIIGYTDEEGIYLLPKLALLHARTLLGHNALPLSASTISRQLDELGLVARKGEGGNIARKMYVGGDRRERLLHLVPDAFERTLGGDEEAEGEAPHAIIFSPSDEELRAIGI